MYRMVDIFWVVFYSAESVKPPMEQTRILAPLCVFCFSAAELISASGCGVIGKLAHAPYGARRRRAVSSLIRRDSSVDMLQRWLNLGEKVI